jgi:hypothetical protein
MLFGFLPSARNLRGGPAGDAHRLDFLIIDRR